MVPPICQHSAMSDASPEVRFVPAPGWPEVRPGAYPPQTWIPSHSLPAPPAGWKFYVDAYDNPIDPPQGAWQPPAHWPHSQSAINEHGGLAGAQATDIPPTADPRIQAFPPMPPAAPPTIGRQTRAPLVLVAAVVALALAGGLVWWNVFRPGPSITTAQLPRVFQPAIGGFEAEGEPVDGSHYAATESFGEGTCAQAYRALYGRATSAVKVTSSSASGGSSTLSTHAFVWPSADLATAFFHETDKAVNDACTSQNTEFKANSTEVGGTSGRSAWRLTDYRARTGAKDSYYYCNVQYGNLTTLFFYIKEMRPSFTADECKQLAEELRKRMDALAAGR